MSSITSSAAARLDSRLYQEVREKRGLAYSVSDSLVWLDHSAVFIGGTATRADRAGETVDLIQKEIHRFAGARSDGEPNSPRPRTTQQLVCAQSRYLDQDRCQLLVQLQLDDLGIDYFQQRRP